MTTLDDLIDMEPVDFAPIEERLELELPHAGQADDVLVIGYGVTTQSQADALVAAGGAFPSDGAYALTRQGLRRLKGLPLEPVPGEDQPDERARRIDLLLHSGFLKGDLRLVAVPEAQPGRRP